MSNIIIMRYSSLQKGFFMDRTDILIKKDVQKRPFNKHWKFCVGSGHATLALRTDYVRLLSKVHDELGIQYVRFHGILNDDMNTLNCLKRQMPAPSAEDFTERNFDACGVAYDNVLAAGMKPFVEISFMPELLAGGKKECVFWYGGNITMPADDDAWTLHIREFIKYLIHRYGKEEVESWYFEIWNEPDLVPVFFWGTRSDYFHLYEITVRAIKEVDPALKVGGPATSGSKWIPEFVNFCRENNVPLDFVSTHQYAGDPLGGVEDTGSGDSLPPIPEELSTTQMKEFLYKDKKEALDAVDEKTFLKGVRAITPDKSELEDIPNDGFEKSARRVREVVKDLPLYYTEWNENATLTAYTNDTRKVAAYDVKAALETEEVLDGSSIWCFSDIFEELHPFVEEFHGSFGMLTKSGIPKPVYHAMKLLGEVGDMRYVLPDDMTKKEIGCGAFEGEGRTDIVLFRQKMKNLDLPKESVSIRLERDEAPSKVTVTRIDEEHGNPYKYWLEKGEPLHLNKAEVQDIIDKTAVKEQDLPFGFENGTVTIETGLGVNDVVFIRVYEG
jgi:xylan 1,4-beta-xylosidase